ncbi:hypothetical protein QAD02_001010 [Eretmocerus hayati]|uniref:Uncharacterized protein n=1 Tax=Eretmocerus hayati TaxID=131215 RepID=A0ACC2NFS3_9HYME|nr:hypothetical protein QAD02_001010 [Eretmocerus hayati]
MSAIEGEEDLRWAFGLNLASLEFMGVWPHQGDSQIWAFLRNVRALLMSGIVIFGAVVPALYALYKVTPNLLLVCDNLASNCACGIGAIKLIFLWKHRRGLEMLMREAIRDWSSEKTSWERSVMKKEAHRARSFTIGGYVAIMCCVFGFDFFPVLRIEHRIINNITDPGMDDGRYFPVQSFYPFDATKSPLYEIMYISMCTAGFFVGTGLMVPDQLFTAMIFHAAAQFEILGRKMRDLFDQIHFEEGDRSVIRMKIREIVNDQVRLVT